MEHNVGLLTAWLAENDHDSANSEVATADEDGVSESLIGFRWAFSNLHYQVARALFTSVGDMIQLNRWRVRLEQLLEDASRVSNVVFKIP